MKWLHDRRREINPSPNRNTVALLVLMDKLCSLLQAYFEEITAGSLSKTLSCKEREILINEDRLARVNFLATNRSSVTRNCIHNRWDK